MLILPYTFSSFQFYQTIIIVKKILIKFGVIVFVGEIMVYALVWVCSLFMIGRNVVSLFAKVFDLIKPERRTIWIEPKSKLFTLIGLILTAVLGIISGIGILLPNQIFGFYLFFIVSGMMIYSYIIYAGSCIDEKKWFMFSLSIVVIIVTIILSIWLAILMASGTID